MEPYEQCIYTTGDQRALFSPNAVQAAAMKQSVAKATTAKGSKSGRSTDFSIRKLFVIFSIPNRWKNAA